MSSKYFDPSITVITDRNATVAEVTLITDMIHDDNGFTPVVVTATGSAKREPSDKPDESIGTDLATGRALEALGRKLQRRADGKVRAAAEAKRVREEKALRGDEPRLVVVPLQELFDSLSRSVFNPFGYRNDRF